MLLWCGVSWDKLRLSSLVWLCSWPRVRFYGLSYGVRSCPRIFEHRELGPPSLRRSSFHSRRSLSKTFSFCSGNARKKVAEKRGGAAQARDTSSSSKARESVRCRGRSLRASELRRPPLHSESAGVERCVFQIVTAALEADNPFDRDTTSANRCGRVPVIKFRN